jgi:hypothetical protein
MTIKVTYNVTDVYVTQDVSPVYINVSYSSGGGGGAAVWGGITGTLSDQTDLQTALDGKFDDPTGDTTQYIAGDGSLVAFPITGQAGTLVREVRNVTGATLTKGTVVYINGASGNKPTVAKALATSDATSAQTFGLIQADIPNNSNGYLVAFGDLDGLNTSAFAEGVQLYLSSTTAGAYTSTKQYAPSHLVYIGVVTRQHVNQGRIEVRIQNGYEMDELHDVAAQTPSNNDGLFYNSTNSLWENKSIATALGYTPANAATTLTINGVTYDLSANRTWTISTGITGSGAAGQVSYWDGTTSQAGSNNLFWDNANGRLGIGTNVPATIIDAKGDRATITITDTNSGGTNPTFFGAFADFLQLSVNRNPSTGIFAQTGKATSQISLEGAANASSIRFFATNTNNTIPDERLRLYGSGNLLIQSGGTYSDNGQRLQVQGTTLLNGNVTFSSSTGMTWDATNSRLGIGTNAPATSAEIATSGARLRFNQTSGGSIFHGIEFATSGGVYASLLGNQFTGEVRLTTAASYFPTFYASGSEGMRLTTNRNLILQNGGTFTDSGERLQVTGTSKFAGNTSVTGGNLSVFNSSAPTINFQDQTGLNNSYQNASFGIWSSSPRAFLINVWGKTSISINSHNFNNTGYSTTTLNSTPQNGFSSENGGHSLVIPLQATIARGLTFQRNDNTLNTNNHDAIRLSSATYGTYTFFRVDDIGNTYARGGAVYGSETSNASAILQADSTTKGFLPPRMTTTQKNAISSPAAGLVVYDTTLNKLCVYTTAWETITSA